jgi:hypothetical protein
LKSSLLSQLCYFVEHFDVLQVEDGSVVHFELQVALQHFAFLSHLRVQLLNHRFKCVSDLFPLISILLRLQHLIKHLPVYHTRNILPLLVFLRVEHKRLTAFRDKLLLDTKPVAWFVHLVLLWLILVLLQDLLHNMIDY